ncbi:hypothetical protein Pint_15180 [Pistacia integerrima]|uniref:Uncharacterized protein n=1 Tax=Pistacia integerrima TaxID=434235 RepID=A0ACC0ZHJ9_9ROSI|nr:hypothetical protein Pint_15180 [Pistacia integerrima]
MRNFTIIPENIGISQCKRVTATGDRTKTRPISIPVPVLENWKSRISARFQFCSVGTSRILNRNRD